MQQTYNADGTPVSARPLGYTLTSQTVINQGTTSYTYPSGTRALFVVAIAGGGAGGGGATAAVSAAGGGGGGSGCYVESFLTTLPATPVTVQVGAGGTAGTAGNNPGNNGTDTTFNTTTVVAKAGTGGGGAAAGTTPVFVLGGAAGAASGCTADIAYDGNTGGDSYCPSGTVGSSGQGAPGPFGGAPLPKIAAGAGPAGAKYGSGGSGGLVLNGSSAVSGGIGGNGVLIIWEFA